MDSLSTSTRASHSLTLPGIKIISQVKGATSVEDVLQTNDLRWEGGLYISYDIIKLLQLFDFLKLPNDLHGVCSL